jgi:Sulfotransferase family
VCIKCWLHAELRQLQMNTTCSRLRNGTEDQLTLAPSYERMYVDDTRHYIYCAVGKVANTNWKRTLLKLSRTSRAFRRFPRKSIDHKFVDVHNIKFTDQILKRLVHFTPDEVQFRLNNYYKFMFVRKPLERLLSAYRDKMIKDVFYLRKLAPVIAEKYRRGTDYPLSEYVE